jgi:hypothetical protein
MIKYVCDECGSEDVLFDAYATWNFKKQQMEIMETYDKGHYCNNCDRERAIKQVVVSRFKKRLPLGLLLIYGKGLPNAGVPFLAPMTTYSFKLTREAMRICAERWPLDDPREIYAGRLASGELSEGEAEDRVAVLASKVWAGNKYEWSYEQDRFVLLEEE